eukprot:CAMPEP_0119315264 /NCGR_PEP_ID=MMETSP1333-20130426/35068_1 /TAXON_ID=418940 /ORGANISM="Scyphosphaera apsteinii, Strain RCC1455" /LENGTH=397 /DNA_ID=CAMNT_0007320565 /DNA_START=38 /DNA_END=1231 /DNA_ORIENTATION=+
MCPVLTLAVNVRYDTACPGHTFSTTARDDRTRIGTLSVPQLGIGTIAWTPKTDEDESRITSVARAAKSAGLNFFDTAERYGASPASLIPAALAGLGLPIDSSYLGGDCESNLANWGDGAIVATKFTPTPWRRTARSVVDACTESAKRLGVEQIDLYQVHMPDIIQPFSALGIMERKDAVYWDGLAECYHRGLVANVGVSNYGPTLVEQAQEALARRGVPLASNQINFNLLYRRQGSLATLERCSELGVSVLAYYPLAMGLLTSKLTLSKLQGKRDARSKDLLRYLDGGSGGTAGQVPEGGIRPLLAVLHTVAARVGKTPAQVSLNWIICKGAIPIPGASSPLQVEENLGALGWRLSEADVSELDQAADKLAFEFNGCGFQTSDSKFVGYGFERWQLD